jgi:hypothetical protein
VRIDRPVETLDHVARTLRFTAEQQETILAHFISGQDRTSGGVLQAVTSAAQTVTDAPPPTTWKASGSGPWNWPPPTSAPAD